MQITLDKFNLKRSTTINIFSRSIINKAACSVEKSKPKIYLFIM